MYRDKRDEERAYLEGMLAPDSVSTWESSTLPVIQMNW